VVQRGAFGVHDALAGPPLEPLYEGAQTLGLVALELARLLDQETPAAEGIATAAVEDADVGDLAVTHEVVDQACQALLAPVGVAPAQVAKPLGDTAVVVAEARAQVVE